VYLSLIWKWQELRGSELEIMALRLFCLVGVRRVPLPFELRQKVWGVIISRIVTIGEHADQIFASQDESDALGEWLEETRGEKEKMEP
jgi:hypothetical protein